MIRVICDQFPDPLPDNIAAAVIGQNSVLVNGVNKPALYFNNHDIELAQSLGGEILVTE